MKTTASLGVTISSDILAALIHALEIAIANREQREGQDVWPVTVQAWRQMHRAFIDAKKEIGEEGKEDFSTFRIDVPGLDCIEVSVVKEEDDEQ